MRAVPAAFPATSATTAVLALEYLGHLAQEPSVDRGEGVDLVDGPARRKGAVDGEEPAVGRPREGLLQAPRAFAPAGRGARDRRSGRARRCPTILSAFWIASSKLRPIAMTSPTDFISLPMPIVDALELAEVPRGTLTTQ